MPVRLGQRHIANDEIRMTNDELQSINRGTARPFVIWVSSFIRHSTFVILTSHLFRHFDPEQIETALQHSPGEIAQCKPRTARRLFRFQNRASFVKRVEAVG